MLKTKAIVLLFLGVCHAVSGEEDEDISITDAPYQVSLQDSKSHEHVCGGSILSNRWILTAGHCQETASYPVDKYVVVGMTRRSKGGVVHIVKQAIRHPEFESMDTYSYDICLLELKKPIIFNARAQPVRLPADDEVLPVNEDALVQGWRSMSQGEDDSEYSDNLKQSTLTIWEPEACAEKYELDEELFIGEEATLMCAGCNRSDEEEGEDEEDNCNGDAGSPLTYNGVQYGIVSFGMADGDLDYPHVFTNVFNLRDFIYEHTDVEKPPAEGDRKCGITIGKDGEDDGKCGVTILKRKCGITIGKDGEDDGKCGVTILKRKCGITIGKDGEDDRKCGITIGKDGEDDRKCGVTILKRKCGVTIGKDGEDDRKCGVTILKRKCGITIGKDGEENRKCGVTIGKDGEDSRKCGVTIL